jgi:L-ascorbate metabolism protein UlaG (beta-lactamase superfamily)
LPRLRRARPGGAATPDRPSPTPGGEQWLLPPAAPDARLRVTFLGVSTLLFDDGETAILTDGFFSRPGKLRTLLGRVAPDIAVVDAMLRRAGISQLAAVIVGHGHYDHVMDAPTVAARTGAVLVGSTSTAMIGRGAGLDDGRIITPDAGQPLTLGGFTVTLLPSAHVPPHRFDGELAHPPIPPTRVSGYRLGPCYSILVGHDQRRMLVHGSAGYRSGALTGHPASVVYLGIGGLARQSRRYQERYWQETVVAVGARRVIPIHWDDFWRSLHRPLRPMPRPIDHIRAALAFLASRAATDGVDLRLPTPWQPTDPFSGL